jgi:ATP-binding cassette subfamily B protein
MAETVSTALSGLLRQLWSCLSQRRRRQFVLLMVLVVVNAFAEVFTLGALLPFLGILISPERFLRHPAAAAIAQHWGISSPGQLVLPATVLFATSALISGSIRILLSWSSMRLAYATGSDLSSEVYRRTLYQPYDVQVSVNSSEVISGIITKIAETVYALSQVLLIISSSLVLVMVVITLLAIDARIAGIAIGAFGCSYAVLTWVSRRRLRRNSLQIASQSTRAVKALQEGLGGIRDVLLDGTQQVYCEIYRRADTALRYAQGNNQFMSASPRFAMEALSMVLISALAYGMSRQPEGLSAAIPVLGTLALGAQRLLPALQQAYASWAYVAGAQGSIAVTVELLQQPVAATATGPAPEPLRLQRQIRFQGVSFRYSAAGPWVLSDLNCVIQKGSRVAFVGTTGSGKSTALDLLMALLQPVTGQLLVDDEPVTGLRARAWQRAIAHVPQSIFLADATIAQNIAFGVPTEQIDMQRVAMAAEQAQIAEFVTSQVLGYDALVGERGVRISGGQRQRIGIARALYKQASVLIFDEATSALDNSTEQAVMESIHRLNKELTIVLIAHRLSTVRQCDNIIELEQGRVVAQGTFDRLLETSPSFQRMARAVA